VGGCLLLLGCLAGGAVRAGGYYLPDRGVRAFSRGGAFAVGCDDLSALWYNPATLAGQPGTRLHLDGALIDFSMHFERYPLAEIGELYAPVDNHAPPLPDPSLAVSSDFGLQDWVFAAGAYGPYIGPARFDEDGAQRYALTRSDNLGYFLEVAAAWQALRGLRIGAGLALVTLTVNLTHAASSFPGLFGGPEDRDQDGYVQFIAEDSFNPVGLVGLWLKPGAWFGSDFGLELGAAVMSGVDFAAAGVLRSRLPDHYYYDNVRLEPEEPDMVTRFSFPWVVRAGLRYLDPGARYDLEVDFVWEGWSVFDQITFETSQDVYYRDVPTIGDYLVELRPLERRFRDTWSLRVGGSFHPLGWFGLEPLDWLVVRLGGYYETGATPAETFSVATPDADKWAVCVGLGTVLGAVEIDLGYMHVFQLDQDIQPGTSRYLQTNPSNPEGAVYVGDGYYQSSYDVFGFSLLLRIDRWF
jgi:long-subunit fatty acid transport protein